MEDIIHRHGRASRIETIGTSYHGLFGDTLATFNSIVSNSYYGRLSGQIHDNFPSEHPIIAACF